ncbi:MAG: alanyl-tRNA editing protein [Lachnospiraceae bacterium]
MNKLYYDSAYIKEFEAQVLSCQEGKKGWEITLSATAFYPEGGGQPADTGLLGNVRVTDVHEKDGQVVHYTDGPLPVGEMVRGVIDWDRRFQHMQEHSGEHLVSGLIHQRFGYDNVGFHMGTDEVTIDFNGVLEWGDLMAIEEKANGMIWENLEISAVYPEKDELDAMEYRSKKELTGAVRIVSIPGGDVCACCGTHVERTGEIGLVKFLSMIHYKGVSVFLFSAENGPWRIMRGNGTRSRRSLYCCQPGLVRSPELWRSLRMKRQSSRKNLWQPMTSLLPVRSGI